MKDYIVIRDYGIEDYSTNRLVIAKRGERISSKNKYFIREFCKKIGEMKTGRVLKINGKEYEYSDYYVFKNARGVRIQITNFLLKNEAGGVDVIGVECEIPEYLDYIDIFALDKKCQKRIFEGDKIKVE